MSQRDDFDVISRLRRRAEQSQPEELRRPVLAVVIQDGIADSALPEGKVRRFNNFTTPSPEFQKYLSP